LIDVKVLASSSKGNCYLIDDGKTRLLLDAGVKLSKIQQAVGFDVGSISGALITHNHNDHSLCVDELIKRGVNVYGNADVASMNDGVNHIPEGRKVGIGTFDVIAKGMEHDIPCSCFYLRSLATGDILLYITDTKSVHYKFHDVTQLIIEANYDHRLLLANAYKPSSLKHRIINSHLSIEQATECVREMDQRKLKEVYLCHLSDEDSDADMFRREIEKVTEADVYICEKYGGVTCRT